MRFVPPCLPSKSVIPPSGPISARNQAPRVPRHCLQGRRASSALQPSRQRPDPAVPPQCGHAGAASVQVVLPAARTVGRTLTSSDTGTTMRSFTSTLLVCFACRRYFPPRLQATTRGDRQQATPLCVPLRSITRQDQNEESRLRRCPS
jgi:hypothetical protein